MVTLPSFKALGEPLLERDSAKRSHFSLGVACLVESASIAFGAVTEMQRKRCAARRCASNCIQPDGLLPNAPAAPHCRVGHSQEAEN
jgi:hypothetical protein